MEAERRKRDEKINDEKGKETRKKIMKAKIRIFKDFFF